MPLFVFALSTLLPFLGFVSLRYRRQRQRRQLDDLLYLAAAMAWVSACSDGAPRHAA